MLSALVVGKEASAVAIRILGGEKPGQIKVGPIGFAAPIYDWRELRRWGISESRLPPGSEVLFRDPSLWEKYRWQIALICVLVLLQGGLIAGLLHAALNADRATNRIHHAGKFHEHPVTSRFYDPPVMVCNTGINQLASVRLKRFNSSYLISPH